MAGEGISTKVSVLGDQEYKKSLQDIGRRLTILNTEMTATTTSFGDQADGMEAMEAKADGLKRAYEAQAEKVKLVSEQLNKENEATNKNQKNIDELTIALNRAQTAMYKAGNAIAKNDRSMAEMADSTTKAAAAQNEAKSDSEKLADVLSEAANKCAAYDQGLREVERSMKRGANESDSLAKKQELLKQKFDAQGKAADATADAYRASVRESGEFSKESVALSKKLQDQKDALGKIQKEIVENNAAMDKSKSATDDMAAAADKATKAIDGEAAAADKAKGDNAKLASAAADAEKAVDKEGDAADKAKGGNARLASAAADAEKAVDKEGDAADDAEDKNAKLGDAMGKVGDVAKGAMKAGLEAAAAAIAAMSTAALAGAKQIIQMGTDSQQATNQLSAQTGATGAELKALGAIAQNVYNNNFGENIGDVNEALAVTKVNTGLMGDELQKATESGYLLRDTFGMDFTESSRAAASLMEKFGISSEKAYNLIAVGAQNGANQNGDMLDVLSEYAPKYAELGLSADDFMNSLVTGADHGVFQIDKVGDAVKEFSIRAIDGSDTTSEAFKALGLNATHLSAEISEGGPQAKAAFTEVVKALQGMEDPLQRNQLAVALFGTQYEDLGEGALPILASIAESGTIATDALGQINDVKYNDAGSALEGVKRKIKNEFLPLANNMQSMIVGTLSTIDTALADGFQPEDVRVVGEAIAGALMEGVATIDTLLSDNMAIVTEGLGTIVGVIVEALPALVDAILPAAMGLLQSVVNAVAGNIEPLSALAVDIVTGVANFLIANASGLFGAATSLLTGLVDGISEALPTLLPAAASMIAEIVTGLADSLPALIESAAGLLQSIVDGILGALPVLVEALPQIVTSITDTLTTAMPTLLAQGASILTSIITGITDTIPTLLEALPQIITSITDTLTTALPTLLEQGASILTSIITGITDTIPTLLEAVPQIITSITDTITTALPTLLEQGTGILTNIITGITDAIPTLLEALPQIITSITDTISTALPDMLTQGTSILTNIITGITDTIPTLVEKIPEIITAIVTALTEALPTILAQGVGILTSVITGIGDTIPTLVEKMPAVLAAITDALGSIDWLELGMNLIQGLVDGLTAGVTALLESIKGVFTSIWDAIKGVFGINSPSTVAKEAGGFILDGLLAGFSEAIDAVVETVKTIFGKIWDAIKSIFGFGESEESAEAKEAGKDIMTGMQTGITDNEASVKETVRGVSTMVLDTLKTELGVTDGNSTKTKSMGEGIAKGLADGLNAVTSETFAAGALKLANAVADAVNSAFGVAGTGFLSMGESSAKKFEAIGKAVCKAVADGITNNTENTEAVKAAITGVANAAYEAAVTDMATGITGGSETVNAAVDVVANDAMSAAAAIINDDTGGATGKDYMDGLKRAVSAAKPSLISTITQTTRNTHDAAKRELSATNGQRIGTALVQGIQSGINSQSSNLNSTSRSLASGALSALWGAVGSGGSKFQAIGNAISQGVAQGIRNGASKVSSAARDVARSAYNASKKELGIASPSKVMTSIGENYTESFGLGITRRMDTALRSARQLSTQAVGETAAGARAFPALSQPQIDYEQLGEAVAAANKRAGLGNTTLAVDGRALGQTVEPSVSRATYQRGNKSVTGRTARMALI